MKSWWKIGLVSILSVAVLVVVGATQVEIKNPNAGVEEASPKGQAEGPYLKAGSAAPISIPWVIRILVAFALRILLGPHQEVNRSAELPDTIGGHIGETLVRETPEGKIIPNLAVSWEPACVPDGCSLTLNLRKGVKFHDGTLFNAEAVKINLEQILRCGVDAAQALIKKRKTKIEVLDEYQVRLVMKPSIALRRLLLILADPALGMYSPKTIDGCKHRPVGTGPFKVKEGGSKSPEYVLLEKNHDYWGELPRLDEIRFSSVLEDITRISMLMEGEAHVATRVPPGPAKQLQERLDTHVRAVSSTKTVYIGMNIRKEPFKDKRVRQAVNYCVDKEEIVDIILFGFGHVSDAPIAPTIFGYQQIGDYPYDPEKGKALLEEAGYKDGFETTLLAPDVYPLVHVAYAVQAYLEKCDIRARVFVLEWVALLDMLRGEEHEMFLLFQTPLIRDAHHALFPVFHSTGSWNRTFYENPAVDELLKRAETELDEEARIELYREAMEIIWEDAPWLFLYTPYILTGVREEVKGLIIYPDGRIDASKAWIEEIEA